MKDANIGESLTAHVLFRTELLEVMTTSNTVIDRLLIIADRIRV